MVQGSMLMLWMDENASQQSILQTGLDCSYTGNRSRGAQQVNYAGNNDVFCCGFNFVSPKLTRTNLIFVVTPSL